MVQTHRRRPHKSCKGSISAPFLRSTQAARFSSSNTQSTTFTMAPSSIPKRSTHIMETRSRSRSKKFPINLLPVDVRIKIYELARERNIYELVNGVYYKVPWWRTILLSGILNDLEAVERAAVQREETRDNMCTILAHVGNLKALQLARKDRRTLVSNKWIRVTPCPFEEETCSAAARGGHLEVLKWLHEQNCPWDEWTSAGAALFGHFNVLKWLHENQCPFTVSSCNLAARSGHLEILKWLYKLQCPINADTCDEASRAGHLHILKWLHRNKCPWDRRNTKNSATYGDLEMLKWLRSKKCPWDFTVFVEAAHNGHRKLLDWAIDNGCPPDDFFSADRYREKCDSTCRDLAFGRQMGWYKYRSVQR